MFPKALQCVPVIISSIILLPARSLCILAVYHLCMLCALDSVTSEAQAKPAATKQGIASVCM